MKFPPLAGEAVSHPHPPVEILQWTSARASCLTCSVFPMPPKVQTNAAAGHARSSLSLCGIVSDRFPALRPTDFLAARSGCGVKVLQRVEQNIKRTSLWVSYSPENLVRIYR